MDNSDAEWRLYRSVIVDTLVAFVVHSSHFLIIYKLFKNIFYFQLFFILQFENYQH